MATMVERQRPQDPRKERGGVFRILIGEHLGDGPPGCDCLDCYNSGGKNHRYRARRDRPIRSGNVVLEKDPDEYTGDLIESKQDLCERLNQEPYSIKFQRVANLPATPVPAPQQAPRKS